MVSFALLYRSEQRREGTPVADDAGVAAYSSPVAVAAALADMTGEERARWRTADYPGRAAPAERNLDIPFPYGWFPALLSTELAPGGVRALRYFGRDLAVGR